MVQQYIGADGERAKYIEELHNNQFRSIPGCPSSLSAVTPVNVQYLAYARLGRKFKVAASPSNALLSQFLVC